MSVGIDACMCAISVNGINSLAVAFTEKEMYQ